MTFPDGKVQRWPSEFYTAFGQPRQFIDERNNTTNMEYWPWGPMKKLATVTTHRSKDGGGNEDQPTSFLYNPLGRPLKATFPDASYEETTYEFGQVKTFRTRKGQKKVIDQYDARGREKHHFWLAPDGNVDTQTSGITRGWDDANRLNNISNVFSTITYGYDDAGQMKWEKSFVAGSGVWKEVSYCRYPGGEVARTTYPDGTSVARSYTARGQLAGLGWDGGSTSYAYVADGKVDYQARTNGVTTRYGYDGRGFINVIRHSKDAAPSHDLAKREYWWDERDRITAWKRGTDNYFNQMEDGRGSRFGYDAEGQLTSASYRALIAQDGTASDAKRTDAFDYDQLGNRKGMSHVASRGQWMNVARRDNGLNQYLNWNNDPEHPVPDPLHWGSGIFHDDNFGSPYVPPGNGVTMGDGYVTASYNALNQPVAIWSQAYNGTSNFMWFGFDPLGRCVKRWKGSTATGYPGYTGATFFYYDGWNLAQEGRMAAPSERTYVHGGRTDEIVASKLEGVWYNHHYDGQGNCIALSNATGGLVEQYDYDAFGYPYFYTASGGKLGALHTRFLFTGREWLNDLRIYDYRNRMYQPELGRFLQPDPKQFEAGDYNLYRYCHNDPINRTDPMGLKDEKQDEKKLVREVLKLTRTPTGTNLSYTIRYTESGNWNNTKIADHYQEGMKGGSTKAEGTAKQSGLNWNIDLHVDWFVGSKDKNSDVVTRELEHVKDFRDFSAAYARSLSGNVSPAAFSQQVANKAEESRNHYDGSKAQQMSQGAALDKTHNLSMYPKQPATLPEFEDTASKVPYNPTSDPPY